MQVFGCRVCVEVGHSKGECHVVDLYVVEDVGKYQALLEQRLNPTAPKHQKILGDYLGGELLGGCLGGGYGHFDGMGDDDDDDGHRSV